MFNPETSVNGRATGDIQRASKYENLCSNNEVTNALARIMEAISAMKCELDSLRYDRMNSTQTGHYSATQFDWNTQTDGNIVASPDLLHDPRLVNFNHVPREEAYRNIQFPTKVHKETFSNETLSNYERRYSIVNSNGLAENYGLGVFDPECFVNGQQRVYRNSCTASPVRNNVRVQQKSSKGTDQNVEYDLMGHRITPVTLNNDSVDSYTCQTHESFWSQPRQQCRPRMRGFNSFGDLNLTPFTGENKWSVWYAKFETLAKRYGLSEEEKLDELLPLIEGNAAEFLFTQLPRQRLADYSQVIKELNTRFRVLETPRSYAAQFSRRCQGKGETVEQFAAELKVLYDKAHGYRDRQIRDEDLVRRFLDGLKDSQVSVNVEFYKEPETIDEAVFHVVNYMQTRDRHMYLREGSVRRFEEIESKDNMDECVRIVRTKSEEYMDTTEEAKITHGRDLQNNEENKDFGELLACMMQRLDRIAQRVTQRKPRKKHRSKVKCFRCLRLGHFARDCRGNSAMLSDNESRVRQKDDHDAHLNYWGPALVAKEGSNSA